MSIEGPSRRAMLAGWCNVFHQSTENLMIGMFIKPIKARTAAALAPRSWESKACVSQICPRYKNNNIRTDVRRASQTHQVPHVGFPHKLPVARTIMVKPTPNGAADLQAISARGCL